jgi:hypothetical protein
MTSFKFNLSDYNAGRKYETLLLPYVCEAIGHVELSSERSRYDYYNPSLWAELKTRTPKYNSDMSEWLFNSKKSLEFSHDKKLYFFYYFIRDCSFWMIEYNPTLFATFTKYPMQDEDGVIQVNWLIPRQCWTRLVTALPDGLVSNPSALLSCDIPKRQYPRITAS